MTGLREQFDDMRQQIAKAIVFFKKKENSFLGTYDILSRDGNIQINDHNYRLVDKNHVIGNISNGGNYLNITTNDGNVGVLF